MKLRVHVEPCDSDCQGRREPTTGELAVALLESMGCPGCSGTGTIEVKCVTARRVILESKPCLACGGLGVVLPDEMVAAAADAIYANKATHQAKAALSAGLREVADE